MNSYVQRFERIENFGMPLLASNTPPDEEKHPSETSHDNVFVTPPSCTSRNHQKSNFNDNTENCNSKNSPVSDTTSNESRDNYQKQVDSFKRQKTSNDQERYENIRCKLKSLRLRFELACKKIK